MLERVGRYEIIEEIGQGGFAIVHRGRDTALNREVALKELRPILLQDEGWVSHFQYEARTIAQLDHPQIVSIYDLFRVQQRFFIVMRLVPGPSLERLIADRGHLGWQETLRMVTKMAEALDYAHNHNVLHRDLKPANILIDPDRGPMLSDFGLARLTSEHSLGVTTGSIVGTPHYIAPEIWEGDSASPQSDIYALGCITFELLTGQKLFQGQTPLVVMRAHFNPVEFKEDWWPPDAPPTVADVLMTALADKPDQRFASATEFTKTLAGLSLGAKVGKPVKKRDSGPLLTTKLFASINRANLVARPHLTQRMNDAVHSGSKLTLVCAPAGFGKSTLVSCWLGLRRQAPQKQNDPGLLRSQIPDLKSAWFSLDEEDNDPVRFLAYLIAALKTVGSTLEANSLQTPSLPPAEALATAIINDLVTIPHKFVLVLDDYHLISSPYIHETIEFLLEYQPPQMHLVLATREDPPLPLSKLRVKGQIFEVRQDDLRFGSEETAAFLNRSMGLNLTVEAVNALERRTEGWIAGLQLAALSLQGRDEIHVADFIQAFSGSHRYVIDYLVEEVLNLQPKNIRRFLQQTAILDRFSAALCNAVTGHLDSRLILNYLEQVNLFLIPLDDERKWYRYHHLFAEFLQTELPDQKQRELHQRAAIWFEAQGLFSAAIRHALAAEDLTKATALILRAADAALRKGAFVTLAGWLNALPNGFVEANGELAIYQGWVTWMMGDVEKSASYAEAAAAALPPDTPPVIRGKLISLQACLAISRETDGLDLAREALPLLTDTDTFFTGMALLVLGEAQNLMGDNVGAVDTLQKALSFGQRHNDHFMIIGALVNLAQQLNWQGKRREAEALCRQAVQQSFDEKGQLLPMAGFSYITLAEIELHTGDLERTHRHLEKGIQFTDKYAMVGFSITGKLVLAPLQYAMNQPEAALATMQEVLHVVESGNFGSYLAVTAALEADFQLKLGNLLAVERWAQKVRLPDNDESLSLMREIELQTYARYLLATDQHHAAEALLVRLERTARESGRNLILLINCLLEAITYQALNEPEKMRLALEEALSLAEPEHYCEVFMQAGPALVRLLPQVQQVAPVFVNTLLEMAGERFSGLQIQQPTDRASPRINSLVEPLSERELEVLQLIAAGQSNKEAATSLVVTVGTVKKHLSNIFGKLGVNSRTQAVARARELDLIK